MKKLFILCCGFLLFVSSYAQAHAHITFSVGPMYPDDEYQARWMMHQMQVARMQNHLLRAHLRNIQLRQQMDRMNDYYPRTYYWSRHPCDGYMCMAGRVR